MGGCGGAKKSSSSQSYTPKKMRGSSKPLNLQGFGTKKHGGYKAAASFGQASVKMSFGRKY